MQFSRRWNIHDCLDEAYVPFFGALAAACNDVMVACWSTNPLGMLWPEVDAAFVMSGGGNGRAVGGNPAAGDQRVADPSQQRHPGHPADGISEMLDSRSVLHALVVGAAAVRPSTADCFGLIRARMGHQ
jgi:hypothetical protein